MPLRKPKRKWMNLQPLKILVSRRETHSLEEKESIFKRMQMYLNTADKHVSLTMTILVKRYGCAMGITVHFRESSLQTKGKRIAYILFRSTNLKTQ